MGPGRRRRGTRPGGTRRSGLQIWGGRAAETGIELGEQLHRLLAILEPVTEALWELVHAGYDANWFCYIASHATEHAAELDRQTMQRILALPGDLWLDVCG
jgi:hypothetical protein